MRVKCIVPKCISNNFKHQFTTFPFPKITYNKMNQSQPNLVSLRRIKLWKEACNLPEDYKIEATEPRICYRHFVNEKPAKKMQMKDIDWVPTLNLNGESVEGEAENAENRIENQKLLNKIIEKQDSSGIVSYVNLKENSPERVTTNSGLCTMVIDQETGDVMFVEAESAEIEEPSLIELSPQTKTASRKRKDAEISLSIDKKKPKILNKDAPKESDEEDDQNLLEDLNAFKDKSCQTDITMQIMEEMQTLWNEKHQKTQMMEMSPTTRKSGRSRKQKI